jgi:hypothetical protein
MTISARAFLLGSGGRLRQVDQQQPNNFGIPLSSRPRIEDGDGLLVTMLRPVGPIADQ